MAWQTSQSEALPAPTRSVKILIAGAFGVGKTTAIQAVSETKVLSTEALMTAPSAKYDDVDGVPGKRTTTVVMDYGRLTLEHGLRLYLFGTPGQDRFWFLWDDLARGAIGALVLVDVRRLRDSFAALDYFDERADIPYIVCVNAFDGKITHSADDVADALSLAHGTPLIAIDARQNNQVLWALTALLDHAMSTLRA